VIADDGSGPGTAALVERWRPRLGKLVCLGSPHHGAALERAGNWVHLLLGASRYSAPFAQLARIRSAGVTDMRFGYVLDADWQGGDRFAHRHAPHTLLPLPDGVEPSAANLAAAVKAQLDELGIERPHVAGNSLGAWVALEMGREGWSASVTAISPAGLWREPLGPRERDPHRLARRLRPLVSLALRLRRPREAMLRTFAARPQSIPVDQGRELVLGWIDAGGYAGANRAMRTHLFDPTGYPEEVPVTIAWQKGDRIALRGLVHGGDRVVDAEPDRGHVPLGGQPGRAEKSLGDHPHPGVG